MDKNTHGVELQGARASNGACAQDQICLIALRLRHSAGAMILCFFIPNHKPDRLTLFFKDSLSNTSDTSDSVTEFLVSHVTHVLVVFSLLPKMEKVRILLSKDDL